ncbi:hypothetical protein HDU79_005728 [Rhizoclosmatium sp. JEL0117]|nr:hypothetical protein HDU79_005728 [Rhizoclosmatium sp. JEL0117]
MKQSSHTEQFITNALRRNGLLSVSLVAVDSESNKIIGHVAVSPVTVEGQETKGLFGLGPLSVLPSHQRCGTGSQLVNAALEALRSMSAIGCVVLGNPKFYNRFGFQHTPSLVLGIPGIPQEYFMFIHLDSSAVKPEGTVHYSSAFDATQ